MHRFRLKTLLPVAATSLLLAAASAQAQLYIGVALLYTQLNEDDDYTEFSRKDFTDGDNGWSAYAGYAFTPYFSVELGYSDFGTFHTYGEHSYTGVLEKRATDINSYDISVRASYPVIRSVEIYGRLGHHHWDTKSIKDVYDDGELSNIYRRNFDSRDLFGGVGASVKITDSWNVDAEYRRYLYENDTDTNIDSLRVGLRYDF